MTVRDDLPADVLRFLDSCIDSIEQLQVLLLLHAHPNRVWTALEITQELRSTESSISKRLADLYSRKVLSQVPELGGAHRFSPTTPEVSAVVLKLAQQNAFRPYRVIESIYSRPESKALQAFSDAFKLRND